MIWCTVASLNLFSKTAGTSATQQTYLYLAESHLGGEGDSGAVHITAYVRSLKALPPTLLTRWCRWGAWGAAAEGRCLYLVSQLVSQLILVRPSFSSFCFSFLPFFLYPLTYCIRPLSSYFCFPFFHSFIFFVLNGRTAPALGIGRKSHKFIHSFAANLMKSGTCSSSIMQIVWEHCSACLFYCK